MKNRKGMTLVELLVVIGIIGILATVLMSQFGGATESAKAAQCMNNMRGLSLGVINAATAQTDGVYPSAHSLKYKVINNGKVEWHRYKGWISWTSAGESNGRAKTLGSDIYLGESNNETLLYAITNGAIWAASAKTRDIYTCPIHANLFDKKNGRMPGWSYVMNDRFGMQDDFHWSVRMDGISINRGTQKNPKMTKVVPDKLLMFAELQALTVDAKNAVSVPEPDLGGVGNAGDAVLKSGEGEVIGFNHKVSGGRFVGHVAYADGHVDKIMLPKGGASLNELTQWLCQGYDVSFNGSQYNKVDNAN